MSTEGTFLVGRDPGADIVLEDETVGRKHAEIVVTNGRFFLADLDSLNGVHQLLDDGREVRFNRGWVSASDRFALGRFEASIAELLARLPEARLVTLGIREQIGTVVAEGVRGAAGVRNSARLQGAQRKGKRVRCMSCGHVFLAAEPACPECSTPRG